MRINYGENVKVTFYQPTTIATCGSELSTPEPITQ